MIRCPVCTSENPDDKKYCGECGVNLIEGLTGRLSMNSVLESRYKILRTLGRGGMGAVYLALDQRLNNMRVAIKEMSTNAVGQGNLNSAIASFKKEAAILIDLRHPALPRVIDFFPRGTDRWYLVMDFIEGKNLAAVLGERGRLEEAEVLRWTRQLCEILDFLHGQDPPIIFRDLKPSNIMLTPQDQIKLVDFGIARHFRPGIGSDTAAYGSTGFAPPEQYGDRQTNVRSDIYALGATMHYLLTGIDPKASPFIFDEPKTIVNISPALNNALMKALEFRSEFRPENVRHFWALATGENWFEHPGYKDGGFKPEPKSAAEIILDNQVELQQKQVKDLLAKDSSEKKVIEIPIIPMEEVPKHSSTLDFEEKADQQAAEEDGNDNAALIVPGSAAPVSLEPSVIDTDTKTVPGIAPEFQMFTGAKAVQDSTVIEPETSPAVIMPAIENQNETDTNTRTLPVSSFPESSFTYGAPDYTGKGNSTGTLVLDGIESTSVSPPEIQSIPISQGKAVKPEEMKTKSRPAASPDHRRKQAAAPGKNSGKWVKIIVAAALVITISTGVYISINKKTNIPHLPAQVDTVTQENPANTESTTKPLVQEQPAQPEEIQTNTESSDTNESYSSSGSTSKPRTRSSGSSSSSDSSSGGSSSGGSSQPKGETYDYRI